MNREETKAAIEAMQHFADGGEVEVYDDFLESGKKEWRRASTPAWDWWKSNYRKMPEPREYYIDLAIAKVYGGNPKSFLNDEDIDHIPDYIKVREVIE